MEFGINKCKMIHLERGHLKSTNGFPVNETEMIEVLTEEESYKYLGFLQLRGIKHTAIKATLRTEITSDP